jgi:hypothetical protein
MERDHSKYPPDLCWLEELVLPLLHFEKFDLVSKYLLEVSYKDCSLKLKNSPYLSNIKTIKDKYAK